MTQESTMVANAVGQADVVAFLEHAFRNIDMPALDKDDMADIEGGLCQFLKTRASTPSEPEIPSPGDDDLTRAFIAGWNSRLTETDFDMALHYWMLSQVSIRAAKQNDEARAALEWLAGEMTCEEALSDSTPSPWLVGTPEERIKIMGERKRAHDAAVLNARAGLAQLKASAV